MRFNSTVVYCDNEDECKFRRFPRTMLKNDISGWKLIKYHDQMARKIPGCTLISGNFLLRDLPMQIMRQQDIIEIEAKRLD